MDPSLRWDDGNGIGPASARLGQVGWGSVLPLAAAAALLALAAWLRFAGFAGRPLWLDEAYSAYAAGKGWAFLWQVVPRYETHPPFYYSLLRLWTLPFGDSLAALRLLGLACGMATLPLALLCAREIGRAIGMGRGALAWFQLATLALAALSPMLVLMAREVRPYPVLILVYLAGIHALLRLRRHVAGGGSLASPAFAAYLAALVVTLWLHNLGPLFGAALGLGLLAVGLRPQQMTRRDWLWFAGGHALVLLAYAPALLILIDQAPTWIRSTWLSFDPVLAGWRVATIYAGGRGPVIGVALLLLLLGVGSLARTGEGRRIAILLLVTAILPIVASLTLSALIAPVFIMRTMTPVIAPALLLYAAGASAPGGWLRWAGIAALGYFASQLALVDRGILRSPPMQNWYGAVRWLGPRFQPGDIVYAYPNEGALPFDYAVRDLKLSLPSRPVPTPVPSIGVGGWHPTGSRGVVSLPRERLRAIASEAGGVRTVWLLRLGANAYDKGDVFLHELERGRRPVGRYQSGPIDIIGLRRAD